MLAQDDLIHVELTFQLGDQLLDALLIRRQPAVLLEHPFVNNASGDRIKLRAFDARGLLELCAGLGIGGDQLQARPERRCPASVIDAGHPCLPEGPTSYIQRQTDGVLASGI